MVQYIGPGVPQQPIAVRGNSRQTGMAGLLMANETNQAKIGRSEWIRTTGPCLPKTVLYQAELHSDCTPI